MNDTTLTFSDFGFNETLSASLDAMGFEKPSPIQQLAIPKVLEGKDLIACAQTGTGKTAAFVLPTLNRIINTPEKERHFNTLILAPTRELVTQIDQQIEGFGYFTGVSSIPVYGGGDGMAFAQQKKALESGADIVIATPGRLIAILQMGGIKLDKLKHLILDEADRMLDMGFFDDIMKIVNQLPKERQTLLFSATMPPRIRELAKKILIDPEQVAVAISKPAEGILQKIYLINEDEKVGFICHYLSEEKHQSVIIFASTKESVKKLEIELLRKKVNVKAFHSDLEQREREEIMNEFKARKIQVLIGTDIISRGIDVDGIGLVMNFNAPHDAEDYVHRIGRTARAESTGTAVTLISSRDFRKLQQIEAMIGKEIERFPLPEGFSEVRIEKRPPGQRNDRQEGTKTGGNQKKKKFFNKNKKPKNNNLPSL